jgi:hypothetical protein
LLKVEFMPQEAAAKTVAQAAAEGVTGRTELSSAVTRAGLSGTWLRKDLAALSLAGHGPPGIGAVRGNRHGAWDSQSAVKQRASGPAIPEAATDATGTGL